MIFVDDKRIDFTSFPDGTSSFRFEPKESSTANLVNQKVPMYYIEWKYDDDKECIQLWHLTHHIREANPAAIIWLIMPYVPNARMDRVKNGDEVFTLKWFAEFINALHFDAVFVCDPHSSVSTALINRVQVVDIKASIDSVLKDLNGEEQMDVLFCYPDEGAAKRYSGLCGGDYVFCIKHRDWRTGKIERLELTQPDKVAGRNVLIVDDICSRGGTFTYTAKALKESGAKEIFLYVTHCENTIFSGSVLTDGLIAHVFTTDSIYRGSHPLVTVVV